MSRYSGSTYNLGDSSPISLGRFAQLFKFGSNAPTAVAATADDQAEMETPSLAELESNQIYEMEGSGVPRPFSASSSGVPRLRVQTMTYTHRSVSTPTMLHDSSNSPYLSFDVDDGRKVPKNPNSAPSSSSKGKGTSPRTPTDKGKGNGNSPRTPTGNGKGKRNSATTPTGESRWNFF